MKILDDILLGFIPSRSMMCVIRIGQSNSVRGSVDQRGTTSGM